MDTTMHQSFHQLDHSSQVINLGWCSSWAEMLSISGLSEDALAQFVTTGGEGLKVHTVRRPDLPLGVAQLLVEDASQEVWESLAYSNPQPEVQEFVASVATGDVLKILAAKRTLSVQAQVRIVQRGSGPTILHLFLRGSVEPEVVRAMTFRSEYDIWQACRSLLDSPEEYPVGALGYRFLSWATPYRLKEYVQDQDVPFEEVDSLGEKWRGSVDGLIEAWRLTKR